MRTLRSAVVLALGVATMLVVAAPAHADHLVRIRAETRIELDVRRDGALAIRGALRDDAGVALPGRPLELAVRPERGPARDVRIVTTDRDGGFALTLAADPGPCVVDASFAGERDLEASTVRARVDERLAHVVLTLELEEARLSLDAPTHVVAIRAESAAGGAGLLLHVSNEIGTEIASGATDATGSLALTLASDRLGPPAAGRLIVRSEADATRASAQTETPIVRYRETRIVWMDDATRLDETTILRARLSSSAGPLPQRAVGVYVGDTHVGTRLTTADGVVAISIDPTLAASADTVLVEARFDADAPWLASSVSPRRSLTVPATFRLTPYLAVASAVLFALAALAIRRRPVRAATVDRSSRAPGFAVASSGIAQGQGLRRAWRPTVREISGTVLHAATGEPLQATLRFGAVRASSDAEGRFEIVGEPGTHVMEVEAPGFEPQRQRLTVPHRGEWRGVVIRLESRRDLASRLVLEVLSLVLPGEIASTATDRELIAMARARGLREPEMEQLVQAVEQLVYGDEPPDPSSVAHVRELSTRVRAKLARVDSASAASL